MLFDSPSRKKKDGTYPLQLVIYENGKRKYFRLGKSCTQEEWNPETGYFRKNYPDHNKENSFLRRTLSRAYEVIDSLDRDKIPFSFHVFYSRYIGKKTSTDVATIFQSTIERCEREERVGSASQYRSTKNAILEFCKQSPNIPSNGLMLQNIDFKFLKDFEHWLKVKRNCKDTTISVYMRALRTVFNDAIKEDLISYEFYPFRKYEIGKRLNTKTKKRAISKDIMHQIKDLDLPEGSDLEFARDIFLFIYYGRGINFVDIAFLTPYNIQDNRIVYVRRKNRSKTSKEISIPIRNEVKDLLEKYRQWSYYI